MPGPNMIQQQKAPMPGPNMIQQQQRAPMPGPNMIQQQHQRAPMPGPISSPIEINIQQKRTRTQEDNSLEIVEESGEESDEFSSDHHSIDINEDANFDEDDVDSSSVGSLTF